MRYQPGFSNASAKMRKAGKPAKREIGPQPV
jgi:hypothetical protein